MVHIYTKYLHTSTLLYTRSHCSGWRPGRSVRAVALKIAATNFCLDPVLFFPVFYSLREMLATGELGAHPVRAARAK